MLASSVLQTAVNAYRDAGMSEDSKRVRVLMQKRVEQAREEIVPITTEYQISRKDVEEFCTGVVVPDLGSTFVRLAAEFLPNRKQLEEEVRRTMQSAPLQAMMPQEIVTHDHVVAKIGSIEDDPFGRLLRQATMSFSFSNLWLGRAFESLFATHEVVPDHFVTWANRLAIFEDMTFLLEGIRAWYEGDLTKALHVLVPQAECGLRGVVRQIGKPVTKAHPAVDGASVALTMGDILYSDELKDALGPDLTLYFLALYADPRGMNLRNEVVHGLIEPDNVSEHMIRLLVHTFLVLGVWRELAENRRRSPVGRIVTSM